MANSNLTSINAILKDYYPLPGERIKQYVVDMRRESKWERDTCPLVEVIAHDDNTNATCRNSATSVPWTYLSHDCCEVCCDLYEATETREDVQAWLAEKAKRPPIEQDKSKLSDEVEPHPKTLAHQFASWWKR